MHAASPVLSVWKKFDRRVAVLKLFPGITEEVVRAVLRSTGLKGIIIETYGSGNAPTAAWFLALLKEAIAGGLLVVNISQCPGGMVVQGKYETSRVLQEIGVIGGADMTLEAAVTKLMLLLGEFGVEGARQRMGQSLAGELAS